MVDHRVEVKKLRKLQELMTVSPILLRQMHVGLADDYCERQLDQPAEQVNWMSNLLSPAPTTADGMQLPIQFRERSAKSTIQRVPGDEALDEQADTITDRSSEKKWSETSPGTTKQVQPPQRFFLMNFAINKAELKKEHKQFLRDIVYYGILTSDPMAKLMIVGHADSTGSKSLNTKIANRRAQETEKELRRINDGLHIETMATKGESEPIAENTSVSGRAQNRRVEILVLSWKPIKPVSEILSTLQTGMKPYVFKVANFSGCPFPGTVKSIVEEAFRPIPSIAFDWKGTTASPEDTIFFDHTTDWPRMLGMTGFIFLKSFRQKSICKTPNDVRTCQQLFPETPGFMGRAIANTIVHEVGHAFGLDHVPATDNYMWSVELHPLYTKANKTYDEQVYLNRTLQSKTAMLNSSQLVHIVNRIKEKRSTKSNKVDFQ